MARLIRRWKVRKAALPKFPFNLNLRASWSLNNYDDTESCQMLFSAWEDFDKLVSGEPLLQAIKTFNEVIASWMALPIPRTRRVSSQEALRAADSK